MQKQPTNSRQIWRRRASMVLYAAAALLIVGSVAGVVSRRTLHAERFARVGTDVSALDFSGRRDVITPLTFSTEERVTSASGLRNRLAAIQTVAIRADGSRVVRLGPEGVGGRTISFADGMKVLTHDRLQTRSSTVSEWRPRLTRLPSQGCVESAVEESLLGVEPLLGLDAVKIASGDTTAWYALDYGCVLLTRVIVHSQGGSVSRTILVSASPGDPDAALFSIPDHFVEGPPSALTAIERAQKPCSQECRDGQAAYFKMHDAEYEKFRVMTLK